MNHHRILPRASEVALKIDTEQRQHTEPVHPQIVDLIDVITDIETNRRYFNGLLDHRMTDTIQFNSEFLAWKRLPEDISYIATRLGKLGIVDSGLKWEFGDYNEQSDGSEIFFQEVAKYLEEYPRLNDGRIKALLSFVDFAVECKRKEYSGTEATNLLEDPFIRTMFNALRDQVFDRDVVPMLDTNPYFAVMDP